MTVDTSKPALTIRLCEPRGFCAGVDRAIQIVVLALKKYGAPVYVRHEIVHNKYVVDGLRARGAVFVKELTDIPDDHLDRPVVFSAHGVPKSVPENAQRMKLLYLDATCPLVSKVHKQAMRHQRLGRAVVLVGHAGHPEVVGTMGQLEPGTVLLVEDADDVANLPLDNDADVGFVTQTTLSVDDTADVIAALQARFANLQAPSSESICYATTNRQEAVKQAAPGTDMFLIVGAPNSSNSMRLVEVARRAGASASMLVEGPQDIEWPRLEGASTIGMSAGASAPEILTDAIIDALRERFDVAVDIALTVREDENFLVMRDLRDVALEPSDMAFLNGEAAA